MRPLIFSILILCLFINYIKTDDNVLGSLPPSADDETDSAELAHKIEEDDGLEKKIVKRPFVVFILSSLAVVFMILLTMIVYEYRRLQEANLSKQDEEKSGEKPEENQPEQQQKETALDEAKKEESLLSNKSKGSLLSNKSKGSLPSIK